jgi:hypothetical protein
VLAIFVADVVEQREPISLSKGRPPIPVMLLASPFPKQCG